MSWVAISVMGPIGAAGAAMAALPRKRTVHFHPCQYCKRPPDAGQTSANCIGCGASLQQHTSPITPHHPSSLPVPFVTRDKDGTYSAPEIMNSRDEYELKRKRQREEEEEAQRKKRRDEEDEASRKRCCNTAMGDMLNSGIPGGYDMDITTPL